MHFVPTRRPPVHSSRLERWLGADATARLSQSMRGWYGTPLAVAGVPGDVVAAGDGDFYGDLRAGWEMTALDRLSNAAKRMRRAWRRAALKQQHQLNAGFSSLSDLIAEATAGKKRDFLFLKGGPTGRSNSADSLWRLGTQPPAGSAPGNAPGGTAFDSTATGAFPFTNPTGGDTQHLVRADVLGTVAGNTLMLYDLLFGVNKTMNSTATEAVTGVPTRYQNTVAGSVDSAENNFLFVQAGGTALAATAHNWTVCLYTNHAGTAGQTLPSLAGVSTGTLTDNVDHNSGNWFAPLATGDRGIKALTQMQCSALVATGVTWFMIGHPLALFPCPIANLTCVVDCINTAFNLARVFDNACLAFLEIFKPSATATTYGTMFTTVAG